MLAAAEFTGPETAITVNTQDALDFFAPREVWVGAGKRYIVRPAGYDLLARTGTLFLSRPAAGRQPAFLLLQDNVARIDIRFLARPLTTPTDGEGTALAPPHTTHMLALRAAPIARAARGDAANDTMLPRMLCRAQVHPHVAPAGCAHSV